VDLVSIEVDKNISIGPKCGVNTIGPAFGWKGNPPLWNRYDGDFASECRSESLNLGENEIDRFFLATDGVVLRANLLEITGDRSKKIVLRVDRRHRSEETSLIRGELRLADREQEKHFAPRTD
jgi:hypothetical protein